MVLGVDDSVFIRDTQLEDTGTYTCVASNSIGEAVYEVHVLVEPTAGWCVTIYSSTDNVVSVSKNRAAPVRGVSEDSERDD